MNPITKILQTTYPLIQAPMSWLTNAKFVAAVSDAGGLGVLGPNAGQQTNARDPHEVAERMRAEIKQVQNLTSKSFGLNILTPNDGKSLADTTYTREILKVAFAEGVKYFVVVGTAHQELFQLIKAHQGIIIFRPLTPTVAQMQLGERYGADIAVATGSDEGGVLPKQDFGTFTVVPTMVDAVNIPVLAAGGINDRRGVKAALALGARGVYIGSRFLMTTESPMSPVAKKMVATATHHNLFRVSPTQRSLDTRPAKKYAQVQLATPKDNDLDHQISVNGGVRPGMLQGDFQTGIVSVNTGVDTLKKVLPVKTLIQSLMEA
ncbi:nitronate monooxygenase [Levilactobacillus suantsaii]|uniref:Probable nitronate monooxygenase n=1 Tax=Levilactobacillus suantsaii TaxID=2292255 RepID=A0A4Q0VK34_9LACO|nr:nitronate monooxygenase [Levilactobacillus suantsaii]QMU07647.1 nitronate monooxygenase [Levilactobacillus suantsaii]RXI78628.1 2-nitropropane dioxygenase [Levilactobacillus suantsaii]